MRSRIIYTLSIFIILITLGCATRAPYNPLKISKEDFKSNIKTIALAPITIPEEVDKLKQQQIKVKFESLIESKFRASGYVIIPSREFADISERLIKESGGFFDPTTGKRDEEKFKAAKEKTFREMQAKFKADAVLKSSIIVRQIHFYKNRAIWDGVDESVAPVKAVERFFTGQFDGIVPVLSFIVGIYDLNDIPLYTNIGGIQVLKRLSRGLIYVELLPINESEILTQEEKNIKAVDIVLNPLLKD